MRERCRRSGSEDPSARLAADWLLDNDFLIRRVLAQLRGELPAGFQRRLPRLTAGGHVRVRELAEALYAEGPGELELDEMEAFLADYQRLAPLTIAELWALPALLRLVILSQLVDSLAFVGKEQSGGHPNGLGAVAGRAIRSLRLLAEVHWKEVFSRQSVTEQLLGADPAGAYAEMDFGTRDAYRRAVEEIAVAGDLGETEVAEAALRRAAEQSREDRGHHVGYHLVGAGRRALEREVGAKVRSVKRFVLDHPRLVFFGALALAQIALLAPVAAYLIGVGASAVMMILALALSWIPASVPAGNVVRWALARAVRPVPLPKLDFSRGIPARWRTLIAVPTLLGDREQIDRVVQRLEIHYLSNRDPALSFALLTDHADADRPPSEGEEREQAARLEHAVECVRRLNERHGSRDRRPFHLLHREPRWNAAERKWMGWERKRGKIEELNRYLLGARDTTYALHAGDSTGLRDVVFVLTLDSDTQLPPDGAAPLVGALAHPLNRPEVDAEGRVRSGYTVLQPRVEISPASAGRTLFSRQFSGETGIDIYTRAVSETYQDLFGEGIYVGKGIYDVDAFGRSLRDRVPENALLSHDLFEGLHGRAGLVTDVVVYEDYPAHYPAYVGRLHRWVRGDWQLLPWLFNHVPLATGGRARNRLGLVDRFKILDNMRRSVIWASIVTLLVAGWAFLPGHPLFWTLAALSASGAAAVSSWVRQGLRARQELGRWLLGICFAPLEAVATLDAIVRVLVRMTFTRRRLLEWTTAEEAADHLERAGRAKYFAHLWTGPALAAAIAIALALISWEALAWAAPILVLWLLSPELAWRSSRPAPPLEAELRPADILRLRLVARRTWLFFETFVGPTDNWLPVDHYQERPRGVAAHRTSPTNVGMLLVSQLAAYDLGYIGREALASWASNTLDTLEKLERFRGHIYNWYDTRTLEPLEPRYVSTVDSGNLAGALLTLAAGCEEAAASVPDEDRLRAGFRDTATLLLGAIELWAAGHTEAGMKAKAASTPSLERQARDLVDVLTGVNSGGRTLLREVRERLRGIEDGLLLALRDAPAEAHDPGALRELRLWLAALSRQASDAARDGEAPPAPEVDAAATGARLRSVARRARALMEGMEFGFLYDPERRFFRIGYNATADRLDTHHYDLLASEARLASFLAVTRGEAPLEHWFALGRPLMPGGRQSRTLLSWGGSMFEYLMPRLFMRSHPNTLLSASYRGAVDRQIEHGRSEGVPWGISESGYALLDGLQQYQYRAFGVPGLGMRRGLEEDVVVAPYASMLALPVRPHEVVKNLEALEALGALGPFGFYEAVDFHPRRAPGRRPAVVRSYMAHHHGMSLAAIANLVTGDRMVERFHSDPLVRSGELLLDEHIPPEVAAERPTRVPAGSTDRGLVTLATPAWQPETGVSQVWAVGNGSLTSFVTTDGAGGLRRRGVAISRWDPDPLSELCCRRVYVLDRESGEVFDVAPDPGRSVEQDAHVLFEAGQVELRHRRMGLSLRLRVTVTPSDDVEIQEVEIANESRRARSLRIVGCLEPVIAAEAEAERHPAFSKMFLRCTPLPEIAGALVTRLGREAHLAPRVVFRMAGGAGTEPYLLTIDRAHFLGRNGSVRRPAAVAADRRPPEGTLDPLCACATDLTIEPGERGVVALITAVADRASEAREMAVRFGSPNVVRWAFEDTDKSAARRIERMGVPSRLLPAAQRLLSALLVPDESRRAPPALLARGRPSPPKLWGRGISGDEPIALLSLDRSEPTELLGDVLSAHRYLHSLGVRFDLVLVDRAPTTYVDVGLEELRRLLAQHEAAGLLRQRGGVHVIHADHSSEQELADLAAAALVYLDASMGSLEQQMGRRRERTTELPFHEPVGPPAAAAHDPEIRIEVPALSLDNGFGGFAADEYVVRPEERPPAPWCNVIANEGFGCLTSEAALGSSWSLNAGENRLT
ncbi:MAG TPA: glucoamylase family protein, partial [Longimicrobiales bacterium]|nr:glucoamylase family protein [Longimicrobiales bacterium]